MTHQIRSHQEIVAFGFLHLKKPRGDLVEQDNLANWSSAATIYAAVKGDNRYSNFCRAYAQERFGLLQGLTILDAGCGDGEYTEMFRAKGAHAYGCDGSTAVIDIAKRRNPQCHFDVVDLSKGLPYGDCLFDFVFCNLVLMDIEPISDTVKELYRVLKSSGKLHFSIVHPAFYMAEWARDDEGRIVSKTLRTTSNALRVPSFGGRNRLFIIIGLYLIITICLLTQDSGLSAWMSRVSMKRKRYQTFRCTYSPCLKNSAFQDKR